MTRPTLDQLREQVRAQVLTKGDAAYDEARAVHNGMFDKHPAVIVRAEQTADVVAAVGFARETGAELAVKGGGHSAPGFGTTDGGVLLDLSLMRHVHVDPAARTARASGGSTWGDFNYAAHAYGLATPGGIISTTGVAGLTLGGGIGYLARGYGLTIDNLLSAEVVTADGRILTASKNQHEDLFWALRGGGGNFGVVTSFEFALHPVRDIYAGMFFYELASAGDLLRFFRDWVKDAPREYGAFPAFTVAPPAPFIPESRHGDTLCAAIVHWAGPAGEGERAMRPFRELAPVVAEMTAPMPYPALNAAFDATFPTGIRSYWKGSFVADLTDEAIAAHLEHGPTVPGAPATMHLYPINGACHDVASGDTAFAYRDATFAMVILAGWTDPADDESRIAWVRDYHRAVAPHSQAGGYVNFMGGDEQAQVPDSYGANYPRLVAVKRRYDPGNLFRLNQNIDPGH